MRRWLVLSVILGALGLVGLMQPPAQAGILFNFNSLGEGASNTSVQTYMDGLLPAGASVIVTGSIGEQTYSGDGYVVGPVSGGTVYPLTLGTSDYVGTASASINTPPPVYDTFITNNTGNGSNAITMVFSGLAISSVSFDFEIFPDGTCPSLSKSACGGAPVSGIYPNQPDLDFEALASNGTTVYSYTWYGVQPTGTYTHSPNSGTSANEVAPQLIGHATITFTSPVTELEFIDWPQEIGIDNLQINSVPEPATLLLLGTGLMGAGAFGLRFRRRG